MAAIRKWQSLRQLPGQSLHSADGLTALGTAIAVSQSWPDLPQTLCKDERYHSTLQRDFGPRPLRTDLAACKRHSTLGGKSTTMCVRMSA